MIGETRDLGRAVRTDWAFARKENTPYGRHSAKMDLNFSANFDVLTVKKQVKMARSSTVSSKGQITVPREIRIRPGLKKGDRVELVVENGRTTIRAARAPENPLAKYVGALPPFPGCMR
jgi:AbrB family looped-hinge helix DNA binding protein